MSAERAKIGDRAAISRMIIVRTLEPINGQREHAAIITQVFENEVVNAMVMPGAGMPYPVSDLRHIANVAEGHVCWRWPAKS